jgi:hypothetical protein
MSYEKIFVPVVRKAAFAILLGMAAASPNALWADENGAEPR